MIAGPGLIVRGGVACSRYSVSMFRAWQLPHAHEVPRACHPVFWLRIFASLLRSSRLLHAHGVPRACHPVFWLWIFASLAQADDAPVGLDDLDAYRVALASQPDPSAPLVQFRDLWNRPGAYTGRPVTIEGRVARLFRQPRLGEFPPLVEAWVVSSVGDPFCAVFADETGTQAPEIGSSVRFSGLFLRRIKYQGGDSARIVPLIVGPAPPASLTPRTGFELWSWSMVDWIMGLGAGGLIVLVLARRHFMRPVAVPARSEPHPVFVDGEPDAEGESDENSD